MSANSPQKIDKTPKGSLTSKTLLPLLKSADKSEHLEVEQPRGHLSAALYSTIYSFIGSLSSKKKTQKEEAVEKEETEQTLAISPMSANSLDNKPTAITFPELDEKEGFEVPEPQAEVNILEQLETHQNNEQELEAKNENVISVVEDEGEKMAVELGIEPQPSEENEDNSSNNNEDKASNNNAGDVIGESPIEGTDKSEECALERGSEDQTGSRMEVPSESVGSHSVGYREPKPSGLMEGENEVENKQAPEEVVETIYMKEFDPEEVKEDTANCPQQENQQLMHLESPKMSESQKSTHSEDNNNEESVMQTEEPFNFPTEAEEKVEQECAETEKPQEPQEKEAQVAQEVLVEAPIESKEQQLVIVKNKKPINSVPKPGPNKKNEVKPGPITGLKGRTPSINLNKKPVVDTKSQRLPSSSSKLNNTNISKSKVPAPATDRGSLGIQRKPLAQVGGKGNQNEVKQKIELNKTSSVVVPHQKSAALPHQPESKNNSKKRKAEDSGPKTNLKQLKKNTESLNDTIKAKISIPKDEQKNIMEKEGEPSRENDPNAVQQKTLGKTACVFCGSNIESKNDCRLLVCLHKAHSKCFLNMEKKKKTQCPACNSAASKGDKFKQISAIAGVKKQEKKFAF